MRTYQFFAATALGCVMTVSGSLASAQTARDEGQASAASATEPAAATEAVPASDIVVTGSRIARIGLDSATPVAVVDGEVLRHQGITNVQDAINQLPQIGIPGLSKTNSNFLTSGNGVATVNLRNLGDSRTLVLVNGRRFVPGVAGLSVVDVNDIPADFVDRIEVVTGGASAVYGSDAIAGVVNFVLKDHFDGLSLRVQNGITQRGDDPTYSASLTAGKTFGSEDRGAIMANLTFDRDEGLRSNQRAISQQDCSGAGCGPQSYSSYAAQGRFQLFRGDAASGNNGFATNIFTFDKDNNLVLGFPAGSGFNRQAIRYISTPVERYLGTLVGHFRFSDAATFYAEGTYARVTSSSHLEPLPLDSEDVGFGYRIDNPFVPAAIRQQIVARNGDSDPTNDVDQITFRRRQNEIFSRDNVVKRDTFRIAGGLKGELGSSWRYDASLVYGRLKDHTEAEDVDIAKYALALDAVRDASGAIVCRNAAARAAGCVPINLFGYGSASPAASSYVAAAVPHTEDIKNTEFVASANVTGKLFALPAGPVQTSIGAEYRKERSVDIFDPLTNAGLNSGNQLPNTIGQFDVKEVFGELEVPLLRESRLGHSLSLQGAARYSHYSTVGDVFSWNAGGEYSPVAGVRLRGNYAVANRAPNIAELFSPPAETFPSVTDPCNGVTATSGGTFGAACRAVPSIAAAIARSGSLTYTLADLQGINGFDGGNRALKSEKGRTITAGAVLAPASMRGFSLTIDYFNIRLDNAISTVSRATSIQQCLLTGLPQFCGNVIRNASTGLIRTVNAQNVNIATLSTSGVDVDLKYGSVVGWLEDEDRIDLHILYSHRLKFKVHSDPSAPVNSAVGTLEYANSTTGVGKVFRDKAMANVNYRSGPFGISWTANYVSPMVDTGPAEFAEAAAAGGYLPEVIAHNRIAARFYHDAQLRFDLGDRGRMEFYLGVNNLFDRKPPKLEDAVFNGNVTGTETAADVYDPFGRRFYAGVQLNF